MILRSPWRVLALTIIVGLLFAILLVLDLSPIPDTHIHAFGTTRLVCTRTEGPGSFTDKCRVERGK